MIRPEPCFKCGSRVSCRHRTVDDADLPSFERVDGRATNSPWGAKGNPSGKARVRILEALKERAFKR